MNQELIPSDQELWRFIQKYFAGDTSITPYVQEIFLMDSHIAGTSHLNLEKIEPELDPGAPLLFRREPDNEHDELAVIILDRKERKLGYIPRSKNEILARMMDAGKLLFGKLESKEWKGKWLKIQIRVFLKDL
ncbi:MAG: restriction endonuclease [Firmicutes bacterium]|nr:restriction endonuclease [Bacillota bacterium]